MIPVGIMRHGRGWIKKRCTLCPGRTGRNGRDRGYRVGQMTWIGLRYAGKGTATPEEQTRARAIGEEIARACGLVPFEAPLGHRIV